MKKLLIPICIYSVAVFLLAGAYAPALADEKAGMIIEHLPSTVAQQQEFYVDVMVDPHDTTFNGIQGSVSFSDSTLTFVRAETGTSVLTYFITPPTLKDSTISFSGIILGGFNGVINPFDQQHKLPGEIMRLVFEGKATGTATINTSDVTSTANDGQGTLQTVSDDAVSLQVSSAVAPSEYATPDTVGPTISASVVKEPSLFDGQYALIFSAVDKESGIDHVELQEGNSKAVTIESPYLLHDQSRKSILLLRAYDVAGNVTTITIAPTGHSSTTAILILLALALIILYVIHKKSKHPTHLTQR